MSLELHPLCTLFPRLEGLEFEALKADINANGQLQPIVIYDGMILDGGNRYRACVELGIEPIISEMDLGDYDLLSYVLSVNLLRRHLTPGQHAAIVSAATNWLEAQAHGGDRKSYQAATLPLDTVADRAARSGVSDRTQRMADKVAKADPELAKRVAHGEISLPKAVKQVEGKDSVGGVQSNSPRIQSGEQSSSDPEDDGPGDSELAYLAELEKADQEAYDALVQVALSDDKLAEAIQAINTQKTEIARLRAEVSVMKERQTGLMNEKVQLEAQARRWMGIAKKLGWTPGTSK
ncbi:ParB N-terminal domain-containing protein [Paraburkholderia sediminicola]|uniref:ParB N-terminal domain-containing protein n=1 Tax=Paraburkholderia sediminicola TaxID=458836 RepID=UPI0038BDF183